MKKEALSTVIIKILLAILLFTGMGTIIIGGGYIIGEYYKNITSNQVIKPIDQEENYYDILEKKCDNDSCCLSSLKVMRENNYREANENGECLEGFNGNMMRCITSLKWCELTKEIEWSSCEKDFDCVETQADCCSCNNGGKQIGINKKYLKSWEDTLKEKCQGIDCITLFRCEDGKVVCENNQCKFEGGIKNDNQSDTFDRQTYWNEELGISFKYPSNWEVPKYIKLEEHENFGSYGIQGIIDFNSYGSITILDKDKFNSDYQQCIKVEEENTCQKLFGGDYNGLLKRMSFIKSSQDKNLTDNKHSHCYGETPCSGIEGFDFYCGAIGGYITLRTIRNDVSDVNMARMIGFCGYDIGIQNYYYYVPLVINDKLIGVRFELFPYDSTAYEWGSKEQAYEESKNWEKFSKEFKKSLWEDSMNELIEQEIKQYDLIAESISLK